MSINDFLKRMDQLTDVEVAHVINGTVIQLRSRNMLTKSYAALAPVMARQAMDEAARRAVGFDNLTSLTEQVANNEITPDHGKPSRVSNTKDMGFEEAVLAGLVPKQ